MLDRIIDAAREVRGRNRERGHHDDWDYRGHRMTTMTATTRPGTALTIVDSPGATAGRTVSAAAPSPHSATVGRRRMPQPVTTTFAATIVERHRAKTCRAPAGGEGGSAVVNGRQATVMTASGGLSAREADARLARDGRNVLPAQRSTPLWRRDWRAGEHVEPAERRRVCGYGGSSGAVQVVGLLVRAGGARLNESINEPEASLTFRATNGCSRVCGEDYLDDVVGIAGRGGLDVAG